MPDIKRLNYYNGQFLIDKDFIDEQLYHLEMRRRHNSALHTSGVADGGLQVTPVPENQKQLSVGAGLALDNQGREIVLLTPQTKDLATETANSDIFLTIGYQENKADPPPNSTDPTLFTRWMEQPKLDTTPTQPTDGSVIVLAKVHLDASGNVTSIDQSIRTVAGSKIGSSLQLSSLSVSGNVGIGKPNPEFKLDVSGNARFNLPPGGAPNDFRIIRADNKPGLLVRNNGNVGIGTNSPTEKLQFEDMTTNSNLRISRKAATNDAAGNVPSSLALTIGDGGESGLFIVDERNATNTANNQYIRFDTHEGGGTAQERMRIGPNGNVGIGTGTPASTLHVNVPASSNPLGGLTVDIDSFVNIDNARASYFLQVRDIQAAPPAGRTYFYIRGDGNVGIGTSQPLHLLQVGGSVNGHLGFGESDGSPNAGYIRFGDKTGWKLHIARAKERGAGPINTGTQGVLMTFVDQGNIGIGTMDPQATLHVVGSIKSSMWNVTHLLSDLRFPPGLPITRPFASQGGKLLIIASGSGWRSAPHGIIGMDIQIDGVSKGTASVFTNEATSHKSFATSALVVNGIPAGSHSITLAPLPLTITDENDRFSLTVLEFPFPQ